MIAAEATNWPDPERDRGVRDASGPNPAAFLAWVGGMHGEEVTWRLGSDETWLWSASEREGWTQPGFDDSDWQHAVALPLAPRTYPGVDLSASLLQVTRETDEPIRAALTFNDPLTSALGRPNREQVVTRRDTIASTIEALELTNGETLALRLSEGAQAVFEQFGEDSEAIVSNVFLRSFGRVSAPDERTIALDLLGSAATPETIEDLLWALLMLPEFQLIP